MRMKWIVSGVLTALLSLAEIGVAYTQDKVRGAPVAVPAGAPGQPPGQPGPGGPGKPGDPSAKPGEPGKPADGAKPEAPKTTARPQTPETPANPEELKVEPDAEGKVRFNFQGQPWLGVLEWLARISHKSLDWQEVPSDFLNLRTQRAYSVDEARDLINRHLLDRGFTLLSHGEVLTVANVKKLDPSLVPRVRLSELDERQPHEFVKVSFALDWLMAEKASEELKPYISPNGSLTALKTTNRIEVKDTVANLREIRDLLTEEQSNQGRKRLVEEFKLEHVRASDVVEHLQDLLGLEKKPANSGPMSPEQQQMMMQQQMMRQQQMQQQGQQPQAAKQKPDVHLSINARENSVIVHAPADQMAIISEAVKIIDVPPDRSKSLLRNSARVQGYRMAAIDPEVFVKMIQDTGELDPTTRVQFDKKNRSVIVTGSLADHMLVKTLVTRLDGSDRRFDVIKLRRLEADYVAGTIEFMMGAGEKKQQNNRGWYDPWSWGGGRNTQQEDESKKFRVDADVENNRLLIFANDVERTEIENLLVKLGEIPATGGNTSTVRVLEAIDPADAEQLLRKLKKAWPGLSPHQLQFGPGTNTREEEEPEAPRRAPRKLPQQEKTTERLPVHPLRELPLQVADLQRETPVVTTEALAFAPPKVNDAAEAPLKSETPTDEPAEPSPVATETEKVVTETENADESQEGPKGRIDEGRPAKPASPIRIGRGPDGKLVIASDDPSALDQFEELVSQMAPPRRDYKIFRMKYKSTWAYGVTLNLKDFFEDEDSKKKNNNRGGWWGWGWGGNNQTEESTRRLSKRRPLRFVADTDSNSIIVIGADAAQLKVISELIDLYDVPESKDPQLARMTKVYQVKYSKSRIIADAVKEVYRDLLSTNDPAMQNQNGKKDSAPERSYTFIYGSNGGDDKKPDTPVKFKGALSLGVDELSNTLIISAGEGLLTSVMRTIEELDQSARPTIPRMQVIQMERNIDVGEVQKRLQKLTVKPPQPAKQQPQQQQQPQKPVPGSETTTEIFN